MLDTLKQLVGTAVTSQVVASASLGTGMHLLVYPMDSGIVVALGLEGDAAQRLEPIELLSRRCRNLERFGEWKPALFTDGSLYVARRVDVVDLEKPVLSQDALDAAEELLA